MNSLTPHKQLKSGFDLQPTLKSDILTLRPLLASDFDSLFSVASDPLIWEQHPNSDRYKRDVFEDFFRGAFDSAGAFLISAAEGEVIGSSRYYELKTLTTPHAAATATAVTPLSTPAAAGESEPGKGSSPEIGNVSIGYTFIARKFWGGVMNQEIKRLMLDHAFQFVSEVHFHIGENNLRSRRAIEKIGATLREKAIVNDHLRLTYVITRETYRAAAR